MKNHKTALIAIACCLLAMLTIVAVPMMLVMSFVGGGGAAATQPGCGSTDGLSPDGTPTIDQQTAGLGRRQMTNAYTIYLQGRRQNISEFGIIVALATASQESDFLNLANDGEGGDLASDQTDVGQSVDLDHDGVGTNNGSLGVFQQQYPWWGGIKQLMTPQIAAQKFFNALKAIQGWQDMAVTEAAQAVQSSAYPTAYADDEPLARRLFTAFEKHGDSTDVDNLTTVSGPSTQCGAGDAMVCPPTESPAENGLTPDALRVLRCVNQEFGPHTYSGVGERPTNSTSDHPSGRAVDIMIDSWQAEKGNKEGYAIARWARRHAADLGVTYIIWDARIWSVERNNEGWRPYEHPSGSTDPTSMHLDHVHVSVVGNAAGNDNTTTSEDGTVLPLKAGSYTLSSPYGWRASPTTGESELHGGQDMAAPAGTPIRAAQAGKVTVAEWCDTCGFGYYVVVKTGDTEIYYAHQSKMHVTAGRKVDAGDVIGEVGSTGNSTGDHLHFEVRVNGTAVEPMKWLRGRGLDP